MDFSAPSFIPLSLQAELLAERIPNVRFSRFSEFYPGAFPLHLYTCYCVGRDMAGTKRIEKYRYRGHTFSSRHIHYYLIEWEFDLNQTVTFWVKHGACLRKQIFGFVDQLSLQRTSFIALPHLGLVRLTTIYETFTPYIEVHSAFLINCKNEELIAQSLTSGVIPEDKKESVPRKMKRKIEEVMGFVQYQPKGRQFLLDQVDEL